MQQTKQSVIKVGVIEVPRQIYDMLKEEGLTYTEIGALYRATRDGDGLSLTLYNRLNERMTCSIIDSLQATAARMLKAAKPRRVTSVMLMGAV